MLALPLTGCFSSPPQILTLDPARGSTGVAADAPVRIVFDQVVDRTSVAQRLSVDPAIPHCALQAAFRAPVGATCRVVWDASGTVMTLEHSGALFQPDTRYVFSLSPGVTDRDGVSNGLDHHWDITTAPAPLVRGLSPSDGATDVPVDQPLVVGFSTAMDPGATADAIRLEPPVPGTRVEPNARDHSRFVVVPGRLLDPDTAYRLVVTSAAVDEHGQPLQRAAAAAFRTGRTTSPGHVLVLARRFGEPPSEALLTALGPAVPGDPVAAATVYTSPVCAQDACGAVRRGGSLEAVLGGALAPDGSRIALVLGDRTAATPVPVLEVIPLPSGDPVTLAGGTLPSWSPDGRQLLYALGDTVHLRTTATGADHLLPAGDPLDAPARWSDDGHLVALQVRAAGGSAHVDLASPALDARYPLPSAGADTSDPVFSPGATAVAVRRDGGPDVAGTWLVPLSGGSTPRRLGSDLTPVAFADGGTLLAVRRPLDADPGLVRVTIAGDVDVVPGGPRASDLSTVVAAPDGHLLAYLLPDDRGTLQAYVENADGSNAGALTAFTPGGVEAIVVSFAGG